MAGYAKKWFQDARMCGKKGARLMINGIWFAIILIAYDIAKIIVLSRLTAREVRKEKIRWYNTHKEQFNSLGF